MFSSCLWRSHGIFEYQLSRSMLSSTSTFRSFSCCGSCSGDSTSPTTMVKENYQLRDGIPCHWLPAHGTQRVLKFALESFWDGKSFVADLQIVAKDLRASIWKQMAEAGLKFIPSNTFSYYDQVLDTAAMLGAVPPRYGFNGGEIGFDVYFSMARGNATLPAMEMTKWFDTNYHYIAPELSPKLSFSYSSHKAVDEYKEAKVALIFESMRNLIIRNLTTEDSQ